MFIIENEINKSLSLLYVFMCTVTSGYSEDERAFVLICTAGTAGL